MEMDDTELIVSADDHDLLLGEVKVEDEDEDVLMMQDESLEQEDVERLLADDEEAEEEEEEEQEEDNNMEQRDDSKEGARPSRGGGGRGIRPLMAQRGRFFRGPGLLGRMPMRMPPILGRGYFNPMMMMMGGGPFPRGPPPPPPPFMRYFRGGGPMMMMPPRPMFPPSTRGGPGGRGHGRGGHNTSSATSSSSSKPQPTPLMSIRTPAPVRAMVEQQLMQQQQRAASGAMKRPGSHLMLPTPVPASAPVPAATAAGSSGVVRSNLRQIQCVDEQQPTIAKRPRVTAPPASPQRSVPAPVAAPLFRSNSAVAAMRHTPAPTRITIDTSGRDYPQPPPPVHRQASLQQVPYGGHQQQQHQTSYYAGQQSHPQQVYHHGGSGLEHQQQVVGGYQQRPPPIAQQRPPPVAMAPQSYNNSNLRTIPLTGGDYKPAAASISNKPRSCRLRVTNLPQTITFDEVSKMTTVCGNVKAVNVEGTNAMVEFMEPECAERFYKLYNRKMVRLSILNVTMA